MPKQNREKLLENAVGRENRTLPPSPMKRHAHTGMGLAWISAKQHLA
jgi:hypothetical protein